MDKEERFNELLKNAGITDPKRLEAFNLYLKAHNEAMENKDFPKINSPLATTDIDELNKFSQFQGPTGLKLPDVSIMTFPNTVNFPIINDSLDENVDDHY